MSSPEGGGYPSKNERHDTAWLDLTISEVFEVLERRAERLLGCRPGHRSREASDLVGELYRRLREIPNPKAESRGHLILLSIQVMKSVLADWARERGAQKRGGAGRRAPGEAAREPVARERITLSVLADPRTYSLDDYLDLHETLESLGRQHLQSAQVIDMHIFGGLTVRETAAVLGLKKSTVASRLALARGFILRRMGEGGQ